VQAFNREAQRELKLPNPSIPSRPKYKPFALIPTARSHLIIAEHAENFPDLPAGSSEAPIEFWVVVNDALAIGTQRLNSGIEITRYRSVPHLLDQLTHRLEREYVGLQLYAIGTEPFIWDIARLSRTHGLDRDEFHPTHSGTMRRRVYCVHCRSFTDNVSTTIAVCSGCGAKLQVRDHFSQRLAAFMGVQVDAEVPGELPQIEEAYP
jgi:dimethylamine monooxygenase subunit C